MFLKKNGLALTYSVAKRQDLCGAEIKVYAASSNKRMERKIRNSWKSKEFYKEVLDKVQRKVQCRIILSSSWSGGNKIPLTFTIRASFVKCLMFTKIRLYHSTKFHSD